MTTRFGTLKITRQDSEDRCLFELSRRSPEDVAASLKVAPQQYAHGKRAVLHIGAQIGCAVVHGTVAAQAQPSRMMITFLTEY